MCLLPCRVDFVNILLVTAGPFCTVSIMKVRVPARLLEGRSLHFPRTTIVVLRDPGAVTKANLAWLAQHFMVLADCQQDPSMSCTTLRIRHAGFSARRRICPEDYDSLHGRKLQVPGTGVTLELQHVDKERTRLTLHWLPSVYPAEAVKAVVGSLTGDENADVFRIRNQEGRWGALCHLTLPNPHYALVQLPGKREAWHIIMIALPGRLTECRYCSSADLWSIR